MSKQIFEEAFQRHPRPQLPTKAALLERSRKPGEDRPHANPTTKTRDNEKSTSAVIHEDPWNAMTRLGELIQGEQTWSVGVRLGRLVMVKKVDAETGRKALEKAQLLGQSNLASIAEVFHHESVYYLGFDYLRITLEEVLNVHARLDESQIRVIATSVYAAIKHLASAGIVHTSVSLGSIRLCAKSGNVLLANIDLAVWQTPQLTPNMDLQQLGHVILECMNGQPNKQLRDPTFIKEQRKSNKIFGLERGEQWSGFQLLVDFVEELFNEDKPAISKFDRPHRYVMIPPDPVVLDPVLQLVSLECFAFWRPAVLHTPHS